MPPASNVISTPRWGARFYRSVLIYREVACLSLVAPRALTAATSTATRRWATCAPFTNATTHHHTPPHATTRHRTEHQCPCLQRNLNARLGCSLLPFCVDLQGGGVYVEYGSVSFDNCNIHGNTAGYVRAFHAFHTPPHTTTRHHTPPNPISTPRWGARF